MGSEFLSRTKKTITKHIDTKRVELATPDLFTVKPTDQPRRFVASLKEGVTVARGETLVTQVHQDGVFLLRGNTPIGKLDAPPTDIVAAVQDSGGIANGIVHRVHKLSNKADVSLC